MLLSLAEFPFAFPGTPWAKAVWGLTALSPCKELSVSQNCANPVPQLLAGRGRAGNGTGQFYGLFLFLKAKGVLLVLKT